jgi:hypothetical protein
MAIPTLGLKALEPSFISTSDDHADYFELAVDHFVTTGERLDLEVDEVSQRGDDVSEKVRKGENLNKEEQLLAATMGYGDAYWLTGCFSWEPVYLRILGSPFQTILRYKMRRKIDRYVDMKVQKPDYTQPSEIESFEPGRLRRKVNPSVLMHLDWFKYFLDNLEIENNIDFNKLRRDSIYKILNDREMDPESKKIQKVLCSQDERWVNRFENSFDYTAFWLEYHMRGVEKFRESI